MFFVAFYKRQRKIIEIADRRKSSESSLKVARSDSAAAVGGGDNSPDFQQIQLGSKSVTEKFKQERLQAGKTDELNVELMEQEVTIEY